MRHDTFTHTEADAGAFERQYGPSHGYDGADRPTLAELADDDFLNGRGGPVTPAPRCPQCAGLWLPGWNLVTNSPDAAWAWCLQCKFAMVRPDATGALRAAAQTEVDAHLVKHRPDLIEAHREAS